MTGSRTPPAKPGPPSPRAEAMPKGRQADSARRRQRVIAALNKAAADGTEISVSDQQAAGLRLQFEERDEDLAAARAANRELMTQLNATTGRQ